MPIYEYRCEDGHSFDRFLKLDDYNKAQVCDCGKPAEKIITPTMLNCDIQPWDAYVSPASGKLITSYKERDADMKATGCVDYDEGVKTDSIKKKKSEERKLDKAVDETVEKAFDAMPSSKRERLENEMKHSTLEYERV